MKEPTDTLDYVVWLIYGDFLSDGGEEEKGERARCIGAALQKYPQGLYLEYPTSNIGDGDYYQAACSYSLTEDTSRRDWVAGGFAYQWSEVPAKHPCPAGTGSSCPISPLTRPLSLRNRPGLSQQFWNDLAQIGRELRETTPSTTIK